MNRAERRAMRRKFDDGQDVIVSSPAELQDAMARALRGCAVHVVVLHGAGCDASRCACSPEYLIQPATAANVARGAQADRTWRKDTSS